MKKFNWKYIISGSNIQSIIISFVALAIFGGVSVLLHLADNGAYFFTDILTAFVLFIALYSVYCLLFVKLMIGGEGFYFQTSPLRGKYYSYSDISKAWLSNGTIFGGIPSGFYFNFKTVEGKEFRFQYQNYQSDEIEYLAKKIKRSNAGI